MHRSIMVDEILDFFDIKPGQVGIDLTTGFGGHSKEILKKLNHTGHLHGIDQDPIELPKTRVRLESYGFSKDNFTLHQLNFKDFDEIEDGTEKKVNTFNPFKHAVINKVFYCESCQVMLADLSPQT